MAWTSAEHALPDTLHGHFKGRRCWYTQVRASALEIPHSQEELLVYLLRELVLVGLKVVYSSLLGTLCHINGSYPGRHFRADAAFTKGGRSNSSV